MPGKEPNHDAFKAAAQAVRARIRDDRARAPDALKKVFAYVASHLLDSKLTATRAWAAAGVKDRALLFKSFTGTTLARYIAARRMDVADLAIVTTDLDLASISEYTGYDHYTTFAKHYESRKGKKPKDVVREHLPPPLIAPETSLLATSGLLDEDAAMRLVEDLLRIYPTAAGRIREEAAPEPLIIVDGARWERRRAEAVWRRIRDLPFEEQCRQVRRYLFRSTVLFDLLRKTSRRQGRKSRRRGVEIARLALISLERSDEVFGERIHELRALGWAWLGNAYRLALDFSAAAGAFEQADRAWSTPRAERDLSVLAHICLRKGALRMMQRDYMEATQHVNRSCSLFRQLDETRDEALALIKRARIYIFTDKLSEAVGDLREASRLIDEDEERELAFAIRGNLANALVRAGQAERAARELGRARQLHRVSDDPQGAINLDWIAGDLGELRGDLEEAKSFYQAARAGFRDADERRDYALVSVDLMTIHATQDDWQSVGTLASEALPILGSLSLHPETVATVALLAKAVEAGNFSRRLLNDLRVALRQDPLTTM